MELEGNANHLGVEVQAGLLQRGNTAVGQAPGQR